MIEVVVEAVEVVEVVVVRMLVVVVVLVCSTVVRLLHKVEPTNAPIRAAFVTAMVKGGSDGFALLGGDATQPAGLKILYEGARPPQYQPMKKQGAIILGIGGDSSDRSVGTFYEGVMTTGYATDATDQAVHANIAAAGYGK